MNSIRYLLLWLVAITLLSHPRQATAQGTTAFTYQGQLRDGGTNANGTYTMTFKLYDAVSGGGQIGSTISNSPTLANGLFTVNLDFGAGAFNDAGRWLDITVQAGTNTAETLSPRVQVLPAPYAQFAAVAATVTNGAIKSAQMAANAIATTNIQNGAITTAQIANSAVTNANLTANAVATANIQNGTVTDAKIVSMSGSKVSGAVALATNANYAGSANELHTSVTTSGGTNDGTTFWGVAPSLTANRDLEFSANGVAQMAIYPSGIGTVVFGKLFVNDNLKVNGRIGFNSGGQIEDVSSISFANGVQIEDAGNAGLSIHGGNGGVTLRGSSIISADNSASLRFDTDALAVNGGLNVFGRFTVGTTTTTSVIITTAGDICGNTFCGNSDRNLKDKFTPINSREVLERVANLPISSWNYKTDEQTRHIGPMAQDFYAAFNVGTDEKHIATVDEGGVALAAIQGLNEKLKEKDAKIEAMEKRLADLEELIKSSTHK